MATTGGSHCNRPVVKGPNQSGFLMGCVLTDVTGGTTALVGPLIPINPKASCNVDPPDSSGLGAEFKTVEFQSVQQYMHDETKVIWLS